ncbi:hypothetical protein E2C01_051071 [Portunus trituberculatus]|uniref:Uncharacterized protein n=1 Tax=Portunus trituberculatus TaxID=210409 RepID=A0A5B7GIK3_PORTR|nr:hypothetical protein [Portunus trituberculatus]
MIGAAAVIQEGTDDFEPHTTETTSGETLGNALRGAMSSCVGECHKLFTTGKGSHHYKDCLTIICWFSDVTNRDPRCEPCRREVTWSCRDRIWADLLKARKNLQLLALFSVL